MSAAPFRTLARSGVALALAATLSGACTSDKGPSVTLRFAGEATLEDRCASGDALAGQSVPASEVTKLRFTLVSRDAAGATIGFCDRVFEYAEVDAAPFLRVPARDAAQIDVFVEAFSAGDPGDPASANGVRRLATGALVGVSPSAASLASLRLYRADRTRCAAARLGTARAFHTATRLPDGRVLFVGGLVANANDPTAINLPSEMDGIPVTGAAEIYDPRDQTLVTVDEAPPTPRAFHAAQLLDGSGPCPAGQSAILLSGGLTTSMPAAAILNRGVGLAGGRLTPFKKRGALNESLPTRGAGNEIMCLDVAAHAATRVDLGGVLAGFRASGSDGARLVVAGGLDYDIATLNSAVPHREIDAFPAAGGMPSTGMTGVARIGATLTVFAPGRALLWGGGTVSDPVGELLDGLDGTPTAMPAAVAATAMTESHTATRIGTSADVLVTGGFEVTPGGVNVQPPPAASAVRLVKVSGNTVTASAVGLAGGYVADTICDVATRYRPAGWESAIALSRNRVLVTGGTPSTAAASGARCLDCAAGDASALCAIGQASLYDGTSATLSPTGDGKLQVPRFGHTSTALLDGSVLIAGGLGSNGAGAGQLVGDLEVYNPRALLAPYDDGGGIDDDDPIRALLLEKGLRRAPGAGASDPARPDDPPTCGTL